MLKRGTFSDWKQKFAKTIEDNFKFWEDFDFSRWLWDFRIILNSEDNFEFEDFGDNSKFWGWFCHFEFEDFGDDSKFWG